LTNDQIKQSLGADYLVDMNGATTAADFMTRFEALTLDNFTVSNIDTDTSRVTYNAAGPQAGNMATIGADASAKAAHGYINFTDKPTEGAVITIGDQKIGFYDSTLENYDNDESAKTGLNSDFAIDIKGLTIQQIVDKVVELNASLNDKLTRDVTLSRETKADGSINLKVAAATTGFGGNLISLGVSDDSTAGFNAKFQVGANTAQSMTITINDMRAAALKVSGKDANNNTVTASNGNVAKYVTIANVTDGTTNNAVEFALDVSSHDKATAAISVIQDAIEAVSAERSKLGAYQNRLEHTINNLGTSSENLTAAESRIRDVDMAKEMMEFTKMNILSQAAQAMLAQANQQPQGVLQLLR
jgi:flagellin-like hook-associated protein FlgL